MRKDILDGLRILLVQSDGIVALRLSEAFAELGAEVITTFGLPETFHEIGRNRLDAALVHLDLDGLSALPAAVRLNELGVPLAVVAPNHMSAFLARHLPGAAALEPTAPLEVAVGAVTRVVGRRRPLPRLTVIDHAPQRQKASPSRA